MTDRRDDRPAEPSAHVGAAALAAFRETVFDDVGLLTWLRHPYDREAYVAKVVSVGAERGFSFEAADVWDVLRTGDGVWLEQGVMVVP